MGNGEDGPIRKGDKGFLIRLIGGAAVALLLGALVLGLMDKSRLGSCAARGFLQVTEPPSSD